MRIAALTLAFALGACSSSFHVTAIEDGETDAEVVPAGTLSLVFDTDAVVAGEIVGYRVVFTDDDGELDVTADATLAVRTDLDARFRDGSATLFHAGSHSIEAHFESDAGSWTGRSDVAVSAAGLDAVLLRLDGDVLQAGETLGWSVVGEDAFGNAVDVSDAALEITPVGVSVDGDQLTSTLAQAYTVQALVGDERGTSQTLEVVPGPADAVGFALGGEFAVGGVAFADVALTDAWGNTLPASSWSLVSQGTGEAEIIGDEVQFRSEGWYTFVVDVVDSDVTASMGPYLIDHTLPQLVVSHPDRATASPTGVDVEISASDLHGDVTVTCNDVVMTPDPDGVIRTRIDGAPGAHLLHTVATDLAGNSVADHRAVMIGDQHAAGSRISEGMMARISEGAGGLDALAAIGNGQIDVSDLQDQIPNPVIDELSETCVWWVGCATWYALRVDLRDPSMSGTEVTIDPLANGRISAEIRVNDAQLYWDATGTVAGIDNSGWGYVAADAIAIRIELEPSVVDGQLQLELTNVEGWAEGFDFQIKDWFEDALDFFGFDLDAYVRDKMIAGIQERAEESLPPAIEEALASLSEVATSTEMLGATIDFDATFSSFDVDDHGITVGLGTRFSSPEMRGVSIGSLATPRVTPTWSGTGVELALSRDALNQALHVIWGVGGMEQTLQLSDLGLPDDALEQLIPGTDMNGLSVEPLLPPVLSLGEGAGEIDVVGGDVLVVARDEISGLNMLEVYASGVFDMRAEVQNATQIAMSMADAEPELSIDLESEMEVPFPLDAMESFMAPTFGQVADDILAADTAFELPSMAGFRLDDVSFGAGHAASGYLVAQGALAPESP